MKFILRSAMVLALVGFIGSFFTLSRIDVDAIKSIIRSETMSFSSADISHVQMDILKAGVTIFEAENEEITVRSRGVLVQQEGDKLLITQKENTTYDFPFQDQEAYVELSLPESVIETLDVKSNEGSVALHDVTSQMNVKADRSLIEYHMDKDIQKPVNLHSKQGIIYIELEEKQKNINMNVEAQKGEIQVSEDSDVVISKDKKKATYQHGINESNFQVTNERGDIVIGIGLLDTEYEED